MASGRIVVGVDGSEGSAGAIRWCADYGGRLGFEIVAVHALALPVYTEAVPFASWPTEDKEFRDKMLATVRDEWCAPLRESGVKYDALLVDGSAPWMLTDVADREDADMIVVGSRGRGGFGELLLGSTSHQLAHHSKRPVVIVPPERT